jgi:1-acyl-sn-glycerol-3-phosphate acyltransferase
MKKSFFYFCKWFLLPLFQFLFLDSISGRENIPKNGNFIIAANHNNNLDHFLILLAFKERLGDIYFLGKREGFSGIVRFPLDYFAETVVFNPKNSQREIVLEKMQAILKKGKILVIYPEGNTNRKKELLRGKTGVAEILLKSKLPLVPLGISKSGKIKWRVKIGKPISWEEFKNVNDLRKITDQIMKEIAKLSEKLYPYGN